MHVHTLRLERGVLHHQLVDRTEVQHVLQVSCVAGRGATCVAGGATCVAGRGATCVAGIV